MGEIAEGLLDGTFDSVTGEYLGEGYGFPRSNHWGKKRCKYKPKIKNFIKQKDYTFNMWDCVKAFCDTNETKSFHYKYASENWSEFKLFCKTF